MGTPPPRPDHEKIYHTLNKINDQSEPWDYFPFNDRDFTSVAELTLVPGCPPGLFAEQFVELTPMPPTTGHDAEPTPPPAFSPLPTIIPTHPTASNGLPAGLNITTGTPPMLPSPAIAFPAPLARRATRRHGCAAADLPYLVDKFFYTGADP